MNWNWPGDGSVGAPSTVQLVIGNPSGAIVDTNNHDHYLIQRTMEAIDYSDNLGEPVWASWDLTAGDVGSAMRSTSYYTGTTAYGSFHCAPTPRTSIRRKSSQPM